MSEYICEVIEPPVIGSYRKIAFLEEVVRCRDCEHAFEKDNGMYSCHGNLTEPWDYYNDCPNVTLVPADGFCFCGKRREDG